MLDLLLPTGYLSYSQYKCWKTSKKRYIEEYFKGGKKLDTKYLRFGKDYKHTFSYDVQEPLLNPEVCGVPTLGYIDDFQTISPYCFNEFKTGKIAWTEKKVQQHEQLPWYAMQIKWQYGAMPPFCDLIWIETVENLKGTFWDRADKAVKATGKIVPFRRDFDEREVERLEKDVVKVALEISNAYKAFIQEI